MQEYTPEFPNERRIAGRGGEFLTMLRDELKPYIDQRYRTRTASHDTSLVGSSLGGLLGFLAANEYEQTFGNVAAVSPSFWLSLEANLQLAALQPDQRARLWLDSGQAGPGADGFANTYSVRDAMIRSGAALGPDFTHTTGTNHPHNEAAWAARFPSMLRWLLSNTVPSQDPDISRPAQ
jgi:predicted alpha/beta superfamily hydrolase